MARKANSLARERWVVLSALVQRVEDGPCFGILGGYFQDGTAAHESDCDTIIEVDRARVFGTDEHRLQARFRENHDLRFNRHSQCGKERGQVSNGLVELEMHQSGREFAV